MLHVTNKNNKFLHMTYNESIFKYLKLLWVYLFSKYLTTH